MARRKKPTPRTAIIRVVYRQVEQELAVKGYEEADVLNTALEYVIDQDTSPDAAHGLFDAEATFIKWVD